MGSGVVEIVRRSPELQIKRILEIDPEKGRLLGVEDMLTGRIEDILSDADIDLVLDCTGADVAYTWMKEAMTMGKHVVTSNKKLVSTYLEELTTLAEANGVAFLYEASVGGAIPLLKPLKDSRVWNKIDCVEGVLNGTSNYILTQMERETYEVALSEAQRLGYAEADPSADVDGYDARRKLRIMASMAFGGKIEEEKIALRGIRGLSKEDLDELATLGYRVKLLARAWRKGDGLCAYVMPRAMPQTGVLSNLQGAENMGLIHGDASGPLTFGGYGAGQLPTGYAMMVDAWDIARGRWANCPIGEELLPMKSFKGRFYFRIDDKDAHTILENAAEKMGNGYVSKWVAPEVFRDFNGPVILLEEASDAV